MPNYRLSEAAREDLIIIAQYGDENFGIVQSDHYRDQLKHRFSIIAERPMFFPAVDHIRIGYRRSVCGAHSIYYRIEGDGVEIIRIIGRQDIDKAF
jgi:toxin ParE1/3/4